MLSDVAFPLTSDCHKRKVVDETSLDVRRSGEFRKIEVRRAHAGSDEIINELDEDVSTGVILMRSLTCLASIWCMVGLYLGCPGVND